MCQGIADETSTTRLHGISSDTTVTSCQVIFWGQPTLSEWALSLLTDVVQGTKKHSNVSCKGRIINKLLARMSKRPFTLPNAHSTSYNPSWFDHCCSIEGSLMSCWWVIKSLHECGTESKGWITNQVWTSVPLISTTSPFSYSPVLILMYQFLFINSYGNCVCLWSGTYWVVHLWQR